MSLVISDITRLTWILSELIVYHRQGYTFEWGSWDSWSPCSGPCDGSGYERQRSRACVSQDNGGIADGVQCEQIYVGEPKEEVEECGTGPCQIGIHIVYSC